MIKKSLFILFILILIPLQVSAKRVGDQIYQVSTIDALLDGVYDSNFTFKELKKHGNLGIGTLNGINGEMIGMDGNFYNIRTDGKVYKVKDKDKTPFAAVTFFSKDKDFKVKDIATLNELEIFLDSKIPSKNLFYAFRLDGKFNFIKTRSVPKQKKPYPPLVEVVKKQTVFEYNDIEGTVLGFRCPQYAKGLNVVGYHLHFISKDLKKGGHLLECDIKNAKVQMDTLNKFSMFLPKDKEFFKSDLSKDRAEELEKVEK